MFSKKDHTFFLAALLAIAVAYTCMAIDPGDNGFGALTLWIAPPLLFLGFLLPVFGILGMQPLATAFSFQRFKVNGLKHGFALVVFFTSFFIYLITLEPTASLWDCSEFIASAYKLQVPHTPGNPLLLLIGRLFTMLSFGDVHHVAWTLNIMSALFSALTVFLVYYIIYRLGESIQKDEGNRTRMVLTLSALCGSLCLAVSDTFWFSAVEAETYGASCFFLVLIASMILKGKDLTEPVRSRWLILIFYVSGLSYCIHPMCLLSLPILPFAWYVNTRKLTWKNTIISIVSGLVIIMVINRFVAVGLFELAFSLDVFLVNNVHMPFYSGPVLLLVILVFFFATLLGKYLYHKAYIWSVIFLLCGFTPYLMLFIRSNHNPPIDEANPENLSLVKAYMNRESYPSRPLLYGPYFDAQVDDVMAGKKMYHKGSNVYQLSGRMSEYQYEDTRQTILPRIYSSDPDHIASYKRWMGLSQEEKPNFADNIEFMFTYQLGYMYLRYLMWNFAGRESDVQYSAWLKPWENLRSSSALDSKARNQYWMIPLALGIVGMIYQYKQNRKGFISIAALFLLTGAVLALYLNATPNEPRERDYIYVGSYIAFSCWVGLGIVALYHFLQRWRMPVPVVGMVSICIPLWVFYQNYDDHNRAGRTFQVDNARNILNSCAPGSILFTGGDNDTFPMWYLQEVEGFRTDVRIVVLSYFNADWYINQLSKKYYQSQPFKLTLDKDDYAQYGPNDVLYLQETIKEGIDARKYLGLLKENHTALRIETRTGDRYNILPSRTLQIKVDKEHFSAVKPDALTPDNITEALTVRVTENYLQKNALAVLDLIVSNEWERPIYFNFSSMRDFGLDITPYLVQEGLVYQLLPIHPNERGIALNTHLMYENLIVKADYSNLLNDDVYFNYEDYHLRMIMPLQQSVNALAETYLEEGDNAMAEKVMTEAISKLYPQHLIPSITYLHASHLLLTLGRNDLAGPLSKSVFNYYYDQVTTNTSGEPSEIDSYLLQKSADILALLGQEDYLNSLKALKL